jgi:hypothetical protein
VLDMYSQLLPLRLVGWLLLRCNCVSWCFCSSRNCCCSFNLL